jgi:hypothetical protein
MKTNLKPSLAQEVATLRAELNDIKRHLRQIPSNFHAPTPRTVARTVWQTDHGFVAGDAVGYLVYDGGGVGTVFEKSGHGDTVGIVESVPGPHSFVMVTAGLIDRSKFPTALQTGAGYLTAGSLGLQAAGSFTSSLTYIAVTRDGQVCLPPPGRIPIQCLYFPDADNGCARFYASYAANPLPEYAWCAVPSSEMPIVPCAGYVYASGTGALTDKPEWDWHPGGIINGINEIEFNGYVADQVIVKSVSPVTFALRFREKFGSAIIYLRPASYMREHTSHDPDNIFGVNWSDCTSTNLADSGTVNVNVFNPSANDFANLAVNDLLDILGVENGTVILKPRLSTLADVTLTTSLVSGKLQPAEDDILSWSQSSLRWINRPHYPASGTNGDVLTRVAGVPAWAAPAPGGITSVTMAALANTGFGFSDATIGPKTGTSFTFAYLPFTTKGQISWCSGAAPKVSGQEAASNLNPPSICAVLGITNSQDLIWRESVNGQVMTHDQALGTCKFSYKLQLGDGSNSGALEVGHTSTPGTVKFFLRGTTTVDLTTYPSTTGKTLSLVEVDVCDWTGAAKKMMVIGSAPY